MNGRTDGQKDRGRCVFAEAETEGWGDRRLVPNAAHQRPQIRTPVSASYPALLHATARCRNLKTIQANQPGTYSKLAPGQCWEGSSFLGAPDLSLIPATERLRGQLGAR